VERNWLPQFQQAFDGLQPIAHTVTTRNVTLAGLPVIEVPVVGAQSGKSNRFALIVSGDGGWAGLDRDVAAQLTRNDVPVVGLDSLRYFWKARTPEETAADVARILEHYAVEWHKDRILLIGYSFGADVLPFIATRLPPALRDCIESITLISPSQAATFEFHLSNWLPGSASEGLPLMPEIMKLERPALCLFGKGDTDTVCDAPSGKFLVGTELGPGHHLGGDSVGIVSRILNFAQRGQ
jgi:type IV secretory pathway VirJ component